MFCSDHQETDIQYIMEMLEVAIVIFWKSESIFRVYDRGWGLINIDRSLWRWKNEFKIHVDMQEDVGQIWYYWIEKR